MNVCLAGGGVRDICSDMLLLVFACQCIANLQISCIRAGPGRLPMMHFIIGHQRQNASIRDTGRLLKEELKQSTESSPWSGPWCCFESSRVAIPCPTCVLNPHQRQH